MNLGVRVPLKNIPRTNTPKFKTFAIPYPKSTVAPNSAVN